ncbi:MAG: PD-(D/E)XK nuclease family protein [Bacteroidales bacterium]|jgi:hypothetical protein|nr:PD-(D/E)XK nuclease family protein [Bacteroidales bacterium]
MENLSIIKQEFENYNKKENEFNIFRALHNEMDEVRLHSRFISNLLSKSSHGKGTKFLELFIEKVLKTEPNGLKTEFVLTNAEVLPNEQDREEHKDIDILIYNDTQAIIIENKIFAGDSNHTNKEEGYNGQLERYYNTIKNGKDNAIQREPILVAYLTLTGHQPSPESRGNIKEEIRLIDYTQNINDWLTACIDEIPKENDLISAINQYKKLITDLTSDVGKAKEIRALLSDNIDDALKHKFNETYFARKTDFRLAKDVQWHTADDFFIELETALKTELNADIEDRPKPEEITQVTHGKRNAPSLVIRFVYGNNVFYIANDQNGITLGNPVNNEWECDLDYFPKLKQINFADFSNETTFCMINKKRRAEVIETIIKGIQLSIAKNPNTPIAIVEKLIPELLLHAQNLSNTPKSMDEFDNLIYTLGQINGIHTISKDLYNHILETISSLTHIDDETP